MTHDYGKPSNIYAQLGSIRMSAAEGRDAIANLKRGEAIAALILGAASLPRRAATGMRYDPAKTLILIYDRMGSMPAAERGKAMANVRRAQAKLIRGAAAGVLRIFQTMGQGFSKQYKEFLNYDKR
jgi:hypothetical protein